MTECNAYPSSDLSVVKDHDTWSLAALRIVNQIWAIPSDWPFGRRKAYAQVLIIEALKAAEEFGKRTHR